MISIIVPVLGRPARAQPLVDSIRSASSTNPEIVFVTSPGDDEQHRACLATGERTLEVGWKPGAGDFGRKINYGYRNTERPFVMIGSDDLLFHRWWDAEVLRVAEQTNAAVIGTNDLGNPEVVRKQLFATHPVVRRDYLDEQGGSADGPGYLLHEGYDHNFVDRELWDIALSRGRAVFARRAKVEHLHPHWGKGEMDDTYRKGLKNFQVDQRLYWSRCEKWDKRLTVREQQELHRWRRRMVRA